jgi:Protein of unknown function (DUF2459)
VIAAVAFGAAALLAAAPVRVALQRYPASPAGMTLPAPDSAVAWRVWVADWGYHTSIIIEQPPEWSLGPTGAEQAPFVEYAWGDRRYYMMEDHSIPSLLAALFVRTSTITYVQGWAAPPTLADGARAIFERTLTASQLRALALELEGSIQRQPDGSRVSAWARAPGYDGRFYPAIGEYVWSHACNHWTVARLRAAGLARGATGVVFSRQVGGRLIGFAPAPH